MISVGVDVSKEKSTICILKPYGEIIQKPFEVNHTEKELSKLSLTLKELNDDIRIVMEATGSYHLPILTYFKEQKFYVSVINPLVMKKYCNMTLRKGKTDKLDAIKIANYGIDNWYHLKNYEVCDEVYSQLQILSHQYSRYMRLKVESKIALINLMDRTMPGVKNLLKSNAYTPGKDKLCDFVEEYWHFDNIVNKSKEEFMDHFCEWSKNKGYRTNLAKASTIYELAKDGIPTLDAQLPTTKLMVKEAVRVLKEISNTLDKILSQMNELAKSLKEYDTVRSMDGVGEILAVRIIADIGDVKKFHSSKALIAYCGIDAPPHQSGGFTASKRNISKRGSANLRKTGYEIMQCLKALKPVDNEIYQYMLKKEAEGKASKVAKIAALNKFLRIYYAKVKAIK